MRISDWSSCVCSSDLLADLERYGYVGVARHLGRPECVVQRHIPERRRPQRIIAPHRKGGARDRRLDRGCRPGPRSKCKAAGNDRRSLKELAALKAVGGHGGPLAESQGCIIYRIPLFASDAGCTRSEEHTSELQSLMRISYAVFCLKKKKKRKQKIKLHNK